MHDPEIGTPEEDISFRPLEERDFPLLQRWLNTPHVLRWWDQPGPTLPEVTAKYLPRVRGDEPTRCFLILERGRAIGYIQTYLIDDYPEYAEVVDVQERAAGIDLFIGEPDRVYRGLGATILRRFLRLVVFAAPEVESCIIGPAVSNTGAIRAYEKAGFVRLKTILVPDEAEPELLLRIARDEPAGRGREG